MLLSLVIPAYNEEQNIPKCLAELRSVLREHRIPYEAIVVNDNSTDGTRRVVEAEMEADKAVRLVNRTPPGGFGRAIRSGLAAVRGDVVVIYMADCSDDAHDVVKYYRKIVEEGYDCVFGSRFVKGSKVENYPRFKLVVNRIVNRCIRWMFWTKFNDLTTAFKASRTEVIRACGPYCASHFNLTLEMSLSALIRRYNIVEVPIGWYGRTWGCSNRRVVEMGRRYLSTLLMMFFQKILVSDDIMAERLAGNTGHSSEIADLRGRVAKLEAVLAGDQLNEAKTNLTPQRTDAPTEAPVPAH
jgi:dolichol-phosphate mannosyltransferase